METEIKIETIEEIEHESYYLINLEPLTEEEEEVINPLVPPTSGLRMEILERQDGRYILTNKKLMHFLRVLKAISVVAKEELHKESPSILIVADDRPSADTLLDFASRIFQYENYSIYQQDQEGTVLEGTNYVRGKSKMSAPYGSASIAIFDAIDVVLVLTASHNALKWNGLKFYIKRPIPISGGVMKSVSKHAISLTQIKLSKTYTPKMINADQKNNDYIRELVSNIIDCSVLNGKKILLWPFLGVAPEIVQLIRSYGAEVMLIQEDRNPPDPTRGFDEDMIKKKMHQNNIKIAVMLDADRDRLVFLVKSKDRYVKLSSNELYTSMMNIISKEMDKKFINVRTIPSDPRCDDSSLVTFVTGVGYKHLGLIQYLAASREVPESQLQSAILYHLNNGKYEKVQTTGDIEKIIEDRNVYGDVIFALWEESGGHTFNILKISAEGDGTKISSKLPLIGDKYPAAAILVLCTLVEMGYELTDYIDQSIVGTRTTIKATDEEKVEFLQDFSAKVGQTVDVAGKQYEIGAFSNLEDKVAVIFFQSTDSMLYARPSGTGPKIRVYVFGNQSSANEELDAMAEYLKNY